MKRSVRPGERLAHVLGGPARVRVIVLFACVLGLESADLAAVGAAGPELRASLGISNAKLGLLAAISTFVGALATVPVGALTDRLRRVNLLAAAIALWALAMLASASAQSYEWLLLSRLGLGAVTAAAGPLLASLTGDFFAASERARIYGYILSGELLGAGVGFVVCGSAAGALSWRWAFGILVLPAAALALLVWRTLPEPARGGQSQLEPGAEHIASADEVAASGASGSLQSDGDDLGDEAARRAVLERHVPPIEEHILREDANQLSLGRALGYILRIRTVRWLIVSSSVGYFFFAGMRTFAVSFVRGHFGLGQGAATVFLFVVGIGSLAGVLMSGRLADRLIRGGKVHARIVVPAVSYLLAAGLLLPSFLVSSVLVAAPLFFLAAAGLSAPNPPLDAARLDIVPAGLWGRAEGVRTLVRQTAQAAAPILFGVLADLLGGTGSAFGSGGQASAASARGLDVAFLIMLVPLALNGAGLLLARRGYPRDVATALASDRAEPDQSSSARLPASMSAATRSSKGFSFS